jgi:hypothetical protein
VLPLELWPYFVVNRKIGLDGSRDCTVFGYQRKDVVFVVARSRVRGLNAVGLVGRGTLSRRQATSERVLIANAMYSFSGHAIKRFLLGELTKRVRQTTCGVLTCPLGEKDASFILGDFPGDELQIGRFSDS